jgi:hemolysin III
MKLKHPVSAILHMLGVIFAIFALVALQRSSDNAWEYTSFAIYGTALILLYTASSIYHSLPQQAGGPWQIWRKFDHIMVYLLIAGTYTPFCLISLRGAWGWTIFGLVWGITLIAGVIQAFVIDFPRSWTTTLYITMGWIAVIGIKPLMEALPPAALLGLVIGGLIYSFGGVIYTIKKPNFSRNLGYHEIWHLFVLGGSLTHFWVLYNYVG